MDGRRRKKGHTLSHESIAIGGPQTSARKRNRSPDAGKRGEERRRGLSLAGNTEKKLGAADFYL